MKSKLKQVKKTKQKDMDQLVFKNTKSIKKFDPDLAGPDPI